MAELTKEKFQIIGCDNADADKICRPNITYWQDAWRRLKENKVATGALILLIIVGVMTIIGPTISGYDFKFADVVNKNQVPSAKHWFGTDGLGRDLFARVWRGGRVSILIGLIGTAIQATVGLLYGGVAGYFGGLVDDIMMRIIEIISGIPNLVLVILISMVLGKSMFALIVALTATGWLGTARMVRGQILQVREQEYVLAAHALGAEPSRIIVRHLLPNVLGVMIVSITMQIPGLIFGEAFLSYIGLGIQSPDTSWGALAQAGQQVLMFYPYQLLFPALMISLTMLSFNLLGDGLRDALDPRLRQ